MTQNELLLLVKKEVKGLSSYLTMPTDYENASNTALRETGWSFPVTGNFKINWMLARTKRHLFFMLQTESAHKFKFEQINLQQRFDHYTKLIKTMDEDYQQAVKDNVHEFANVSAILMFGTVADTGHAYEPLTGRDITHDKDQKVLFHPTDSDK